MTNEPNLDLFKMRRQHDAMVTDKIEKIWNGCDECQAIIDGWRHRP